MSETVTPSDTQVQKSASERYRKAQFLWIGSELSPVERLALASFRDHEWDTILYAYEDIQNVPDGITVLDGNEILSAESIFENTFDETPGKTFTTFSNLFRLELLLREGGWWFDADMVAIDKPDKYRDLKDLYVGSTWEIHWHECAINCAMFSLPQNALIEQMRDEARALFLKPDLKFGESGPHLLQKTLRENDAADKIAPFWEFCPYPWRQIRTTCFKDNRGLIENTLRLGKHLIKERLDPDFQSGRVRSGTTAVHLHNEIWRRAGISKTDKFHPASFVGRMMRRHSI